MRMRKKEHPQKALEEFSVGSHCGLEVSAEDCHTEGSMLGHVFFLFFLLILSFPC